MFSALAVGIDGRAMARAVFGNFSRRRRKKSRRSVNRICQTRLAPAVLSAGSLGTMTNRDNRVGAMAGTLLRTPTRYLFSFPHTREAAAVLVAIGTVAVPTSVRAQATAPAATELPPITVIAPSPLAGTRLPKPVSRPVVSRSRTDRAPSAPVEAAAAPAEGSAAPGKR